MNEQCKRNRCARVSLRFTEDEKKYIVESAKSRNMSVSNFILCAAMESSKSRAKDFLPLLEILGKTNSAMEIISKALNKESTAAVDFSRLKTMQQQILREIHTLQTRGG